MTANFFSRRGLGALLLAFGAAAAGNLAAATPAAAEVAVLQGLDKVTARISTFDAPIDRMVAFGSLEITARSCQKTPPEEPPESAAFLEIVDQRPDAEAIALFSGWMFASSPAISAMEHPVYDVWVIDCLTDAEYQAQQAKQAEAAKQAAEAETKSAQ